MQKKLPTLNEIIPVYSVILFIVFTWTLIIMFYFLPSWLVDIPIKEIIDLITYPFSFALLESLLLIFAIYLMGLILPGRFFNDQFTAQGTVTVMFVSIAAITFHPHLSELSLIRLRYLVIIPFIFLLILFGVAVLFSFIFERYKVIPQLITKFSERMVIFLAIYLPIGFLSILLVLIRIVF